MKKWNSTEKAVQLVSQLESLTETLDIKRLEVFCETLSCFRMICPDDPLFLEPLFFKLSFLIKKIEKEMLDCKKEIQHIQKAQKFQSFGLPSERFWRCDA
jgi:hypothetical protein